MQQFAYIARKDFDAFATVLRADHVQTDPRQDVESEFAYALEVNSLDVVLSDEHSVFQWFNYDDALPLLHWQSNASALWELSERIRRSDFRSAGGGA